MMFAPMPLPGLPSSLLSYTLTQGLQVLLEVITGNHFPISVQIDWHAGCFSAGVLTSSEWGAPLWTAACDRVRNPLSKASIWTQTLFNPITCRGSCFFFMGNVARTSHSPNLRSTPRNPSILTPLCLHIVCREHAACIHNVQYTCALYAGECLLRLCGIRMNTLPWLIDTGALIWASHVWQIWFCCIKRGCFNHV